MVIHVVQPGDSLYRIAQLHSVPLPFLIQQNELHEPYRLTPGQTIVVPQPEKDVHRPPRRHARQHCRAERHNRDAAVAEQSAAWRHRPHSAGADACTQLWKQAGTLCGERLRLSEHRPARSAPHTALSDVLIRIFRRF